MHVLLAAALALAATADPPQARVDRSGDPLPAGARFRIGSTRLQFGQAIHGLAVSPDSKLVAAVGHDTIAFWDTATGREVPRLTGWGDANQHVVAFTADGQAVAVNTLQELILIDTITGNIRARLGTTASRLVIAPDGKTLTAVQWDGDAREPLIRTWDLATALPRHTWKYRPDALQRTGSGVFVLTVCISPDGRTLAAVEGYREGSKQLLRLYDAATGKERHRWRATGLMPAACTLSPDGKLLATGTEHGIVHIWDTATGKELRRWKGVQAAGNTNESYAETVFAPDGTTVFCDTPAGLVRRDWRTGKTLRTYPDTAGVPVFLSGGTVMAVCGPVFSLRLLDVATGADHYVLSRPGERFAFSPDSRLIASTEAGALILSDAANGVEVRRRDADVADGPLAIAPDGKTIATLCRDKGIRLWEAATGQPVCTVRSPHRVTRLAFAPGGRQIAAGHAGVASQWDIASGKLLNLWTADSVVVAPDLSIVASADRKNAHIRLTDATTDRLLHTLAGYREVVRYGYTRPKNGSVGVGTMIRPYFSPDGRLLLAGGEAPKRAHDDALYLWNTATGRRMLVLPGETTILNGVAFSPDSRLLALMRNDCRICLVNAATGTVARTLGQGTDRMDVPPAFTPDGRVLVTVVGGLIQVWEVASGGEICRRSGHRGSVHTLTMSPDGRSAATAAYDQTILVWDLVRLVETPPPAESLWTELASRDAVRGRAAIEALVAQGGTALALLRERLPPLRAPDAQQLTRWIAELDSDDFETRQHAEAELDRHADSAAVPLQQALGTKLSLEARRRIEGLLRKHDLGIISPDELRRVRALQVLELIGTPEARALARLLTGAAPR